MIDVTSLEMVRSRQMSTRRVSGQLKKLETFLAAKMCQGVQGDSEAYEELLSKVREVLTGYFSHHLNRWRMNDPIFVDDLVQETMIGIHEKRSTYDNSRPFTAWMYAIARYKMIDLIRRRNHLNLQDELEAADEVASLPLEEMGTAHDINLLLQELSDQQRDVIELTKIQGLSLAETASKTGMSVSAVKVTVHRAIKLLRQKLKKG